MFRSISRKSRSNPHPVGRLGKVIYGLVTAIILIGLAMVWVITKKDTNDKAQDIPYEQDHGSPSEFNDNRVGAVVTAPEDTEKNQNPAEEVSSGAAEEEDKDTTNESQSGSATSWFLISVLTLSTAANGCIAVFIFRQTRQSNRLHIERIKLLNDKKYIEPEELQKTMRDLSEKTRALDKQLSELKQNNQDTVQQLTHQAREAFTKVEKNSTSHLENVEELKSAYLLMRDKLDEKDEEIKRYKEGYDTDKLITSLEGFIKIRDRIDSYAEDGKTSKSDLQRVVEIIENTITTIGAKEIDITVGDNINDDKYLTSVSAKKEVDTDNPDDNGKIASIEKNGYQINGPDTSTVIRKAEVALYKYKTNK